MFHNPVIPRTYTAQVHHAYSVQYPDCSVKRREGEEGGGEEVRGWDGKGGQRRGGELREGG